MDINLINRTTIMGRAAPLGEPALNGLPIGVTLEPEFTSDQLMSPGTYGVFLRNGKNRVGVPLSHSQWVLTD